MSNNINIGTGIPGQQMAMNASQQQYSPQQLAAMQQQASQVANMWQQRRNWMINGSLMSMDEFANEMWPEECAEKTFFYLKYSGKE